VCNREGLLITVSPPWDPAGTASDVDPPKLFTITVLDRTNGDAPLANQEITYEIVLIFDDPSDCEIFATATVTTNAQGQFGIQSGPQLFLPSLVEEKQVVGYVLTVRANTDQCTCLEGCNAACASARPPPVGSDSAWGFDADANECFSLVDGACTNKWGWALGPYPIVLDTSVTVQLIAGADSCNPLLGTDVGTVTATLVGISGNTLTFDYVYTITNPGWFLLNVHIDFWSGQIPPNRVNGEPNCNWAPGQFACSSSMPGATTIEGQCIRTFDTLLNGWFFFPHAVVSQLVLYNA
jgi:hypothetical protein